MTLCYKDMTFCPFYRSCADGDHCYRALTETIKAEAEICGLPISQYMDRPPCYKGTIEIFAAHENDGQTA